MLSKKSKKPVKSVHLYGKPTNVKHQELLKLQELYRNQVNFFIEELISDKQYYLDIYNNNKNSPLVDKLEKENRTKLGSAYGQQCRNHAVKELHNHFIRIRNFLYGYTIDRISNYFVSSIALLNACIQDYTPDDAKSLIIGLMAKVTSKEQQTKEDKEKLEFYQELLGIFSKCLRQEIEDSMAEVKALFFMELENQKTPYLKKTSLQLDSRLFDIEEARDIKADFVISVKTLDSHKRTEIPISTSSNSLRRLNQYNTKSPSLKITAKGIRVSVSFEKRVKPKSKSDNLKAADAGITDLLHTSDGEVFGNYSKVTKHYEETVMPKLGNRRKLQNLMEQYQKELRKPDTSPARKAFLRDKIDKINKMLQGKSSKNRVLRSYYHMQDKEIAQAIRDYLKSIKGTSTTTVIEDINIIEFDRGKKANRRDSMWARGQLLRGLEEALIWHGYSVIKVDPAYTSKLCPKCYNIDDNNRNGKAFRCTHCSHTDDADQNAAINIKNRAYDNEVSDIVEKYRFNTKKRHEALRKLFAERHKKHKTTAA